MFDYPYLDNKGLAIVGNPAFVAKGRESQMKSLVLLKNESNILPLKSGQKVYVQGLDEDIVRQLTEVVSSPKNADVIILKIATPFDQRSDYLLERFFRQGRLDFPTKEKDELLELINSKPTITIISMDRPPVIPEINEATKALIADFQCEDDVILELIFGKFEPSGKLPFEIPSSVQAVREQKEDMPYDSKNPLYAFGYGLSY